jgi:2',3'-cyclic-nucleotide 2'-phosphodiesterase (5'-nucleotidase family)
MNQHKSIYNWLGLGLLALVALGLCYLTMSGRPETESDESPPASSPLSSPLPADLASPLPTQAPLTAEATFELTVLHTNDTWGYLLPCG